jgi:phosphotransacetylase
VRRAWSCRRAPELELDGEMQADMAALCAVDAQELEASGR